MWSLNSITAENLCAFERLDYTPKKGVTTLIFGHNLDNDSQGSNGSGKSAMLECISIGITGDTLRKIKMEEIINDAKESAYIFVALHNDSTDEMLMIERRINRGDSQKVYITSQIGTGVDKATEIVQPSVADYNKYILDRLGLTKDEMFSNFILSKSKFKSFLSASDKEKKEIINRFSNGMMVDASIAKLEEDMSPVQDTLTEAINKVSNLNGSVTAMEEQIANAQNEEVEKKKSKAQRIEELNNMIADKRKIIRENEAEISDKEALLDKIDELEDKVKTLEDSDSSCETAYGVLKLLVEEYDVEELDDWNDKTVELKQKLNAIDKKSDETNDKINALLKDYQKAQKDYDKLDKDEAKFQKDYDKKTATIDNTLKNYDKQIEDIKKSIDDGLNKQRKFNQDIARLENKIAGTITCPNCKHEFVLDESVDVTATRKEIMRMGDELNGISAKCTNDEKEKKSLIHSRDLVVTTSSELESEKLEWIRKLRSQSNNLLKIQGDIESNKTDLQSLMRQAADLDKQIDSVRTAMFDQMYDIIDHEANKLDSSIKLLKNNINVAKGSITTYQKSIEELDTIDDGSILASLKESKKKYEKQLALALSEQDKIEIELNKYKEQTARFVEFKTYLANTKIDSLSQMTNEFLKAIGSDIRIQFSGYTVLKSGKVRDKISISLLRDGIDCGSFDKFSAGEKARVDLANILAMHKLINVNCDEEKGLDLLVLDEILEAVDEAGLANIFDALNQLMITAMIVTHSMVAENYPYRTIVTKLNGVSSINENN